MRTGPIRIRRVPGPAAPASWLDGSKHARKDSRSAIEAALHCRRVDETSNIPGGQFPLDISLKSMAMKYVASNWTLCVEYDLSAMPTRMKETLLSYVAIYGCNDQVQRGPGGPSQDTGSIPLAKTLKALFPRPSEDSASTADERAVEASCVLRLDLCNAITHLHPLKRLSKEMFLTDKDQAAEVVPDSWADDDDDNDEDSQPQEQPAVVVSGLPPHPPGRILRFPNLVHLSLALTPTTGNYQTGLHTAATWIDLIDLATFLPKLLSLSLAYWPCPTLTPHAAMTYATIKNPLSRSIPGVSFGGTDMYSSGDGDWREAVGILKRLSCRTYCLRWLDLTGCEWHPALSRPGLEWNGAWRGIEYMKLGVGWSPELPDEPRLNAEVAAAISTSDTEAKSNQRAYFLQKARNEYVRLQTAAKKVALELRHERQSKGGKWMTIDLSPELQDRP